MNSILSAILEYIVDLFLLRHVRKAQGRSTHRLEDDAADVAKIHILEAVLSVAALIVMFVLYLGFNWPFWLSIALPGAAVGIYLAWRMLGLFRNPD